LDAYNPSQTIAGMARSNKVILTTIL
jgi:hypothetical protein